MAQLIIRRPSYRPLAFYRRPGRLFDSSLSRFLDGSNVWGWPANDIRKALAIDLYETDDNVVVKADLPGLNPEAIDISIEDNALTIKGQVEHSAENGNENSSNDHNYYLRERFYGSFERTVSLPTDVKAEAAEATFENGLLTITLPKAEAVKPRRIEVKAS